MDTREALIQQAPSLALQRSAQTLIAQLDMQIAEQAMEITLLKREKEALLKRINEQRNDNV